MKVDKSTLKIALTLTALFLAIAIPVAIASYYFQYNFSATVGADETALTYLDQACTQQMPQNYDWGIVSDGAILSVWIKNEGNVQIDVTITILSEVDCTVTPSWSAKTLTVNQVEQLTMTVSTSAVGGSTISWDLDINASES